MEWNLWKCFKKSWFVETVCKFGTSSIVYLSILYEFFKGNRFVETRIVGYGLFGEFSTCTIWAKVGSCWIAIALRKNFCGSGFE